MKTKKPRSKMKKETADSCQLNMSTKKIEREAQKSVPTPDKSKSKRGK